MSQVVWTSINPATTSGTDLATLLDAFKNAVMSGLSGTSRPTQLTSGGFWVDTTTAGYLSFKIWDGTTDMEVFRVNSTTGKSEVVSSNGTFEVIKYSADAVAPVLQLIKRRIATNGQVADGDTIGEIQFIGRTATSTNPMVARISVVSTDLETATAFGGYMVFEATVDGASAATEMMRLIDGSLGVGVTAPLGIVHAEGATGIRSSYNADSANPALLVLQKGRLAGTKATQSADEIGRLDVYTTDAASAKVLSAQISTEALEAHTAIARGTKVNVKTSTTGATTPTTKLAVGDRVEVLTVPLRTTAREYVVQSVATTATISALSATNHLIEMTGATGTSIQGIDAAHASKVICIHNRSSAVVTLSHQDASASAANRLKLPASTSINIPAEGSAELYYCDTDTRWKIKALALGDISSSGAVRTSEALASTLRTLSSADNGKIFLCDTGSASIASFAAPATDFIFTIKDRTRDFSLNAVSFVPNGAQKVEGLSSTFVMNAKRGAWTFHFDGTDWSLI